MKTAEAMAIRTIKAFWAALQPASGQKANYSRPFPLGCLIPRGRRLLRLFFGLIAAVEAFGAVLVEPDHNPMKLDHGTPSVSGLALVFGFGFGFGFDHAQLPRSKSGSLAIFDAMRLASSFVSNFAADRRPGSLS